MKKHNNFRILFFISIFLFFNVNILISGGEYPFNVKVGISHFKYYQDTDRAKHVSELTTSTLAHELSTYGFSVYYLGSEPNEYEITYRFSVDHLGSEPNEYEIKRLLDELEFDLIITGIVTGVENETLISRIYEFGKKLPRRFESSGDRAVLHLASMILRHISSREVLFSILLRKREFNIETGNRLEVEFLNEEYDNYKKNINKTSFYYYLREGLYFRTQKAWSKAIESFQKALDIRNDDPDVHYNLSICYEKLDNYEKKIEHLKIAHNLDNFNESVSISLGNHYLNNGDYNKAIEIYSRWLESPYNAPTAHWNLSIVYKRKGNIQNAINHLKSIPRYDRLYGKAQSLISELEEKQKLMSLSIQSKNKIHFNIYKIIGSFFILLFLLITLIFVIRLFRELKTKSRGLSQQKTQLAIVIIGGLFTILSTLMTIFWG